jgi:DNA polymerase
MAGDARKPGFAESLRALLADAEAFGVLGYGAGAAPPAAAMPAAEVADSLDRIAAEAEACRACPLGASRNRAVPGQGNPDADLMFVGEAPGADEDAEGLAFVGLAGQLLTKMIAAMGFTRDDVYIANVLKCRPPDNREPQPQEVAACLPFLERQIRLIRPKVICALGSHAARNVLRTTDGVGRLRGTTHSAFGTRVVVTYHPAYLLRMPQEKKKAWDDLKLVLRTLGSEPPA